MTDELRSLLLLIPNEPDRARAIELLDARLGAVYAERTAVTLAFAAAMEQLGYDVGQIVDENEPDWPVLVVETPRGQASWHMRAEDMPAGMPKHPLPWDGHTVEEKYRRLGRMVALQFAPDRVAINEDGARS